MVPITRDMPNGSILDHTPDFKWPRKMRTFENIVEKGENKFGSFVRILDWSPVEAFYLGESKICHLGMAN